MQGSGLQCPSLLTKEKYTDSEVLFRRVLYEREWVCLTVMKELYRLSLDDNQKPVEENSQVYSYFDHSNNPLKDTQ